MAAYKRFSPNVQSALSVVMMIVIWIAFAPTQVGGLASYIMVIGKSMEPKFHVGDLVIAHRQSIYQIGDAIVYRNLELNNFVFHRIISQEMGQYTLKGDNNSWVDDHRPSHAEVIGKLWLHIPHGGIAIQKARSPFVMALVAGVLGAVIATSLFVNKAKGTKRMNKKPILEWFADVKQKTGNWFKATGSPAPQKPFKVEQEEILEGVFFALGLIALASLIVGMIAFSRPPARIVQDDISYEQLGVFSYLASTPQGVYDANTIKSGDPVFMKLTCTLDVNFQYTLIAGGAEDIAGTYQLTAIISEQVTGWQRIVPLQEETPFTGSAFGTTARLDLCKMASLTQFMEQETDFHPGSYTLTVTPAIKLNGKVSGRALAGVFNPALTFRYDRAQFYLSRIEEQDSPLSFTETGILREQRKEANTMLLLGKEMTIPALRWVALFGLISSLTGFAVLGFRLQNLARFDQEKFFRIRYASMLIDVQNAEAIAGSSPIDLTSMDALAKLAERFNTMILHLQQNDLHAYYVQAGALTYRFTIDIDKTDATIPEASQTTMSEGDKT